MMVGSRNPALADRNVVACLAIFEVLKVHSQHFDILTFGRDTFLACMASSSSSSHTESPHVLFWLDLILALRLQPFGASLTFEEALLRLAAGDYVPQLQPVSLPAFGSAVAQGWPCGGPNSMCQSRRSWLI